MALKPGVNERFVVVDAGEGLELCFGRRLGCFDEVRREVVDPCEGEAVQGEVQVWLNPNSTWCRQMPGCSIGYCRGRDPRHHGKRRNLPSHQRTVLRPSVVGLNLGPV